MIISRKSFYGAILFLFIFLTFRIDAQEPPRKSLTVSVTDEAGAVVPGATVTIDNEAKQRKVTKDTDQNGHAALSVEHGSYQLSVARPGFSSWHTKIDVGGAPPQNIEVKLKAGRGSCGPCVTLKPVWWDELMPLSPPMDDVWVDRR